MSTKTNKSSNTGSTEEQVILANHTQDVCGNVMHFIPADGILRITNEEVNDLPVFRCKNDDLSRAFSTAWLGLIDGRYPLFDRQVALLHTHEDLKAMVSCPWAGYLTLGEDDAYVSPLISKKSFMSLPTDPGVYVLDYLMGQYKVVRNLKATRYVADEPRWVKIARSAFYKHVALSILATGRNVEARHFPRTNKYVQSMDEIISIPDAAERAVESDRRIKTATIKQDEYGLNVYVTKLAEKGEKFESQLEQIKLVNGQLMTKADALGHTFNRTFGTVPMGTVEVTALNVENFFSIAGRHQTLALELVS